MPVRQTVSPASAARFNKYGHGRVHMDFVLGEEIFVPLDNRASWISPVHPDALGLILAALPATRPVDATWPTANTALFFPYCPSRDVATEGGYIINGTVVSGNLDLGIYDAAGNRLRSSGSVAQTGTTTLQTVGWTRISLNQDHLYWIALAFNNITARVPSLNTLLQYTFFGQGSRQTPAAFPLPATIAPDDMQYTSHFPRVYGIIRPPP